MKNIYYQSFCKEDCQEVLDLWRNIQGIHLHTNGEDSVQGITSYLERNPGFSFVAKHDWLSRILIRQLSYPILPNNLGETASFYLT